MKKLFTSTAQLLILTVIFQSCKEDIEPLSPTTNKIAFSFSKATRNVDTTQLAEPTFILFSIKDMNGNTRNGMKLSLARFGKDYLSENLELEPGNYQLNEFVVLDSTLNTVYATPTEGSELANYVADPLPIEFTVGNEEKRLTPQVLAVEPKDNPERFGYASFGFDIAERVAQLNLQIQYYDSASYDSAYIVFRNSETEIKQKLILNNETHTAAGLVPKITLGTWNVSISFFSTITGNYESLEKTAVFDLDITPTATDLISSTNTAFIKDKNDPVNKSIHWMDFYYYQMYSAGSMASEGFVRLPVDPTDAFIEIGTFHPKWIYAYVDRSFYNRSSDGTSNHYQGGGAFEIYGKYGNTYDRLDGDIIDTTSLAPGISKVANKTWNFVDALIIVEGASTNQTLIVYHVWDLRPSNGRVRSHSDATTWNRQKIENRKKIHLP